MFTIIIYKNPYQLPSEINRKKEKKKKTNDDDSIHRSIRRTKTTISDIVKCNEFDYFCTFTFDRRKVDRYNIGRCKHVMSNWLHRQRLHSPELHYLIVPEFHKDKALHFHALIKGYNGRLKDSGKTKNGRKIYNIPGYRSGFSTAVAIDNHYAVSSYIKKYITKDMPVIHGKKRYWISRNLVRPRTFTNSFHQMRDRFLFLQHDYETDEYNAYSALRVDQDLPDKQSAEAPEFEHSAMLR